MTRFRNAPDVGAFYFEDAVAAIKNDGFFIGRVDFTMQPRESHKSAELVKQCLEYIDKFYSDQVCEDFPYQLYRVVRCNVNSAETGGAPADAEGVTEGAEDVTEGAEGGVPADAEDATEGVEGGAPADAKSVTPTDVDGAYVCADGALVCDLLITVAKTMPEGERRDE
jgi:hypothetical protein